MQPINEKLNEIQIKVDREIRRRCWSPSLPNTIAEMAFEIPQTIFNQPISSDLLLTEYIIVVAIREGTAENQKALANPYQHISGTSYSQITKQS